MKTLRFDVATFAKNIEDKSRKGELEDVIRTITNMVVLLTEHALSNNTRPEESVMYITATLLPGVVEE